MSFEGDGAHGGQALGDRRGFQVGAGDLVAEVQQHLGDAAHADAADADEMNALNFGEHESQLSVASSSGCQRMTLGYIVGGWYASECGPRGQQFLRPHRGWANWRAAAPICAKRARLPSSEATSCARRSAGELGLRQQAGSIGIGEGLGVVALMIVGGGRQRNEDGRLPGGRDLGDGAGSGAAHQQIGASEGARHVVDEGRHLGGNPCVRS